MQFIGSFFYPDIRGSQRIIEAWPKDLERSY